MHSISLSANTKWAELQQSEVDVMCGGHVYNHVKFIHDSVFQELFKSVDF